MALRIRRFLAPLMLVVLACAGCSSGEEEPDLSAIQALGGKVKFDGQGQVIEIDLSRTRVDDLAPLKLLPNLRVLNCTNAPLSGADFEALANLHALETLYLDGTELDDDGLAQLRGLTSLKALYLGRTKIDDAGLSNLRGLRGLTSLSLANTAVTDAGLAPLRDLHQLQTLVLRNTKVTPKGVQDLGRSLPKTRIDR